MTEREFPAETSVLDEVLAFAEEQLEEAGCPMKTMMAVTVAIEEMFVNVARYAYPEGGGSVTLSAQAQQGRSITFCLRDRGIPFDPLAKTDPDITLPAEEREIGGLGIYMMKKNMDEAAYSRENGENILSMTKYF